MATTDLRVGLLFGRRVIDGNGQDIGRVHDVRLRRDGPVIPGFGPALRVEGLIVGEGSFATRLGLDRTDITGPWPLSTWGKRVAHRAHFIPWETLEPHDDCYTTNLTTAELPRAYP
jgi:hypothetical protein